MYWYALTGNGTGTASNYTFAETSATWTISRAPVTISLTKAYYVTSGASAFTWTTYYGTTSDAAPESYVYAGAGVYQGYLLHFEGFVDGQYLGYHQKVATSTPQLSAFYNLNDPTGNKYSGSVSQGTIDTSYTGRWTIDDFLIAQNAAGD